MDPDSLKNNDDWPVVPEPSEAEIGRIRRNAVEFGGDALPTAHKPRQIEYRMTPMGGYPGARRFLESAACGEIAQFTVPIDGQAWQLDTGRIPDRRFFTERQKQANGTKMCVIDDSAHLWPRFQ